jgi:hypothetical protein
MIPSLRVFTATSTEWPTVRLLAGVRVVTLVLVALFVVVGLNVDDKRN